MLFDGILLILLLLAFPRGYKSGFTRQLSHLLALLVALLVASPLSLWLSDLLSTEGISIRATWILWSLSFLLAGATAQLLLGYLLSGLRILLGSLDKLAGALLAFLSTALLFALLLQAYSSIGSRYHWPPTPATSKISPILEELGKTLLPQRLFKHKSKPQEKKSIEEELDI